MSNMSDLSIELESTEKSYPYPFKDISLNSVALIPLEMLQRQNWVGKLAVSFKEVFLFH